MQIFFHVVIVKHETHHLHDFVVKFVTFNVNRVNFYQEQCTVTLIQRKRRSKNRLGAEMIVVIFFFFSYRNIYCRKTKYRNVSFFQYRAALIQITVMHSFLWLSLLPSLMVKRVIYSVVKSVLKCQYRMVWRSVLSTTLIYKYLVNIINYISFIIFIIVVVIIW